jgi:hypothetical protein
VKTAPPPTDVTTTPVEVLPARVGAHPLATSAQGTDERRVAVRRQELVNESIGLLLRGGDTWLEVKRAREASAREDEASARRIAELDAQTRAEVARIEAHLGGAREQTDRLRLLLDYLATNPTLDPAIAQAIAQAIPALTAHPGTHDTP